MFFWVLAPRTVMGEAHNAGREGRKRGIPPAPPQRATIDAVATGDDALALAVWQALRNVLIWARTPEGRRGRLFRRLPAYARARYADAAEAAPELGGALHTFTALQSAPGEMTADRLAVACNAVWEWARLRGSNDVAAHYAEAAAYVEPDTPTRAVVAGYATRARGGLEMLRRSDAWHARALALAVRNNDPTEAVRALTGRGALYKEWGRYDEARAAYTLAAGRALYTKRKRQAAVVWHYIFALSVDTGTGDPVAEAATALDLYPIDDERLPALAYDVAYLLIRRQYAHSAFSILERAVNRFFDPGIVALASGAMARAAACAARVERVEAAERQALEILSTYDEYAAQTYVHLAEAARSLRAWDRSADHAHRAALVARERADVSVERLACAALDAAVRRVPAAPALTMPSSDPLASLARLLVARLNRWRGRKRIGAATIQGVTSGH